MTRDFISSRRPPCIATERESWMLYIRIRATTSTYERVDPAMTTIGLRQEELDLEWLRLWGRMNLVARSCPTIVVGRGRDTVEVEIWVRTWLALMVRRSTKCPGLTLALTSHLRSHLRSPHAHPIQTELIELVSKTELSKLRPFDATPLLKKVITTANQKCKSFEESLSIRPSAIVHMDMAMDMTMDKGMVDMVDMTMMDMMDMDVDSAGTCETTGLRV